MVSGIQAIDPAKLTDEDLGWLIRCEEAIPVGFKALDLIRMARSKTLVLFRITGQAKGILVVEPRSWPKGNELRVWCMAGKGVFPYQVKFLIDDLLRVCVRWNCRWLAFTNRHPQVDRIYSRYMGKPFGVEYVKEL